MIFFYFPRGSPGALRFTPTAWRQDLRGILIDMY